MQVFSSNCTPKRSVVSLSGRSTHCAASAHVPPPNPRPSQNPEVHCMHGEPPRPDPFRWLHAGHRNPRVLQYLQQENDYSKLQLRHIMPLRKQIEDEIAELIWRQAIMMAAQQQSQQPDTASPTFSSYTYRREPLASGPGLYRHFRVPQPKPPRPTAPPTLHPQQTSLPPTTAPPQFPASPIPTPPSSHTTAHLPSHQPQQPRDGTQLVLDESQRAAAGTSPASYTLHTFAPSPSFSFTAFTEACDAAPQGERRPDRFTLHVIDAVSCQPLVAPLADVSGDVGWVVAPPQTANYRPLPTRNASDEQQTAESLTAVHVRQDPYGYGSTEEDQLGSCRLYFTRAAQRELCVMDFPSSSLMTSSPAALATPEQRQFHEHQHHQHHQHHQLGDDIRAGDTGAVSATTSRTHIVPRLVFREPYGQPIQLVRYGRHLYAQCLSNTGVPLEVRWLGVANGVAERRATVAGDGAGLVVLPRQPGREYSVLSLSSSTLGQGPDVTTAAAAGDLNGDVITVHDEPLLLWVRDVTRPNGCLLLASVGGGSLSVTELVAHDPGFRILHVETRGTDRVMRVCVAVDERGDPMGRYELQELQIDWKAVRQQADRVRHAGVGCEEGSAEAGGLWSSGCMEIRQAVGGGRTSELEGTAVVAGQGGCSGGTVQLMDGEKQPPMQAGVDNSIFGCSLPPVSVRRRRSVSITGTRHHVLRVLAWDDIDGTVTLSYSSMATPPALSTVRLLPYCPSTYPVNCNVQQQIKQQQRGKQRQHEQVDKMKTMDEQQPAAMEGAMDSASGAVQLHCGGSDPRVVTERLWATSHDGVQIPITLCRPLGATGGTSRDTSGPSIPCSGPVPLLLRVYGAYGRDPPLDYQPSLLPMLRRGVAVATAHVRGGGLLGPGWYEGGRGAAKCNSYLDLVAVATQLVGCGVTSRRMMCLEAESAGGWAAGPALNNAVTSLFRAAVLTVPTLDPLTSLLENPTYGPYELGDPRSDPALYRAVRRWAPYDGLGRRTAADKGNGGECQYPALLLRVGLYDTNVPYWDPAKYMARLRSLAAVEDSGGGVGSALRVMQVKAGGHEVYDTVPDDATRCAFVLWALGTWPSPSAAKSVLPSSRVASQVSRTGVTGPSTRRRG